MALNILTERPSSHFLPKLRLQYTCLADSEPISRARPWQAEQRHSKESSEIVLSLMETLSLNSIPGFLPLCLACRDLPREVLSR